MILKIFNNFLDIMKGISIINNLCITHSKWWSIKLIEHIPYSKYNDRWEKKLLKEKIVNTHNKFLAESEYKL